MINSLSEAEGAIVRAAEPKALAGLSEDELLELHGRVRRVRDRYQGQYRRQAAARVSTTGGRGKAREQNQRARDKAEVFETTLARVSTALAKAARKSAADLRAERLATARAVRSTRAASGPTDVVPRRVSRTRPQPPRKSTGRLKRDAGDIAVGRRNQAKRDTR
jgi:hypothetical protein